MNIFVSTQETQGQRTNDFCHVPEGEMVIPPVITCDNETADGRCGCCRSMTGIITHKATTTMKVATFNGGFLTLMGIIEKSLRDAGWTSIDDDDVTEFAKAIIEEAAKFPTGTVVEYRDYVFAARTKEVIAQL